LTILDENSYVTTKNVEFPTSSFTAYKKDHVPMDANKGFAYFMVGAAGMGYPSFSYFF
jgi:hypothetical protein